MTARKRTDNSGRKLCVRRDWDFGDAAFLRVEGELALPLICDDLLAGSSLL